MNLRNIPSILIFLVICSCGSGTNNRSAMKEIATSADFAGSDAINQQNANTTLTPVERKINRTGEIRFETDDINKTEALVKQSIKEFNGYISSDNAYSSADRITRQVVVRIPAAGFDSLLEKISASARKIENKTVNASDVTEEYIDIETRIRTKKDLENRYRELLSKAKTVEDMLSIEKEMGTLRTEIESIEGRLRYLKDQVSQSTLTIEYWQRTGTSFEFGSQTGQAVVTGWKWLLAFIVGVVHFWPFILIAVIIIVVSFRLSRKKS